MESLSSTFRTSRGLTYSFIHVAPRSSPSLSSKSSSCSELTPTLPYVLFLHGFPSLAIDFYPQISHLASLGYPIIAPDLLGYGRSSRPSNPSDYLHKLIIQDLIELVDHVGVPTESGMIGIAHDFGAQVLTRLDMYHPTRLFQLVFLTIGPVTVAQPFDLDLVNDMTKKMLGYEGFGYQEFLTRDADANVLLCDNHDRFTELMFTTDYDLWKKFFGSIGGLRKWLENDKGAQRGEGILSKRGLIANFNERLLREHRDAFGRADMSLDGGHNATVRGGYAGAICWYTGLVQNLNIADDRGRLHELGITDREQTYKFARGKKVLLITAAQDPIAIPDIQAQMTKACVDDAESDLTIKQVDAGHWVGLEKADEVNCLIERFLQQ